MTTTAVLLVPKKAYQSRSTGEAVDAAIELAGGTGPMRAIPTARLFNPWRIELPWTDTLAIAPEDAARLAERYLAVNLVGANANRNELDPGVLAAARRVGAILAEQAPWTTLGLWRALLRGSRIDALAEQTVQFTEPEWPPPVVHGILWLTFG